MLVVQNSERAKRLDLLAKRGGLYVLLDVAPAGEKGRAKAGW